MIKSNFPSFFLKTIIKSAILMIMMNSCVSEPVSVETVVNAEPAAVPVAIPVTDTIEPVTVTITEPDTIAELTEPDAIAEPDLIELVTDTISPPERIIIPPVPIYILGQGIIPAETLAEFLLLSNPLDKEFALEFAEIYIEEAAIENINHDVAFAQMCLETGFLNFGGLVIPEHNNFGGLGATGPGHPGLWFPDARTGVRAQIQHLKAYATEEPLNQELVNPRYFLVRLGSSPRISGLAGTWAADPLYAGKINSILERLYEFSFSRVTTP